MTSTLVTVDEYIGSCPAEVRPILAAVRSTIQSAVQGGEESIRYGMPAIALPDGYRVYFAAWKRHIGIYPIPTLDDALESELAPHRTGKDSLSFPLGDPIPLSLIERVVTAVARRRVE